MNGMQLQTQPDCRQMDCHGFTSSNMFRKHMIRKVLHTNIILALCNRKQALQYIIEYTEMHSLILTQW